MAPFSHFAVIAYALVAIAAALWIALLKSFGLFRWLRYQWLDLKACLFDAPGDDEGYECWLSGCMEHEPADPLRNPPPPPPPDCGEVLHRRPRPKPADIIRKQRGKKS
jgi:hypothetical protein